MPHGKRPRIRAARPVLSVLRARRVYVPQRSSSARILCKTSAKRLSTYGAQESVASAEQLPRSAEGRLLPSGRKKGRKKSQKFGLRMRGQKELFAEAQKMAQLRYKTYIRKSQENWED